MSNASLGWVARGLKRTRPLGKRAGAKYISSVNRTPQGYSFDAYLGGWRDRAQANVALDQTTLASALRRAVERLA